MSRSTLSIRVLSFVLLSACASAPGAGRWSFERVAWESSSCSSDLLELIPTEEAAATITREGDGFVLDTVLGSTTCSSSDQGFDCEPLVVLSIDLSEVADDPETGMDVLQSYIATYAATFPNPRTGWFDVGFEARCEGSDCALAEDVDEEGVMGSCSATGEQRAELVDAE